MSRPRTPLPAAATEPDGADEGAARHAVEFVVPAWVDDPARVSGGNVYDIAVGEALVERGWRVRMHRIAVGDDAMSAALAGVPDGAVVLVDGLLAARAPAALERRAAGLRLVVLAHMVEGSSADGAAADGERRALRAARAVVATSRWTRDELIARGPVPAERIAVAAPAVADGPRSSSGTAAGERLLCVGPIAPHKGQDILVRALAGIDPGRSWTCTLVGSLETAPDFAASLRAEIDAAGLGERIRFAGVLTGSRLAERFSTTDLLVAPSREEPFGMAAAETSAHGIPVLAARVGGLPEAIAANGGRMFVPGGDARALRRELERWWADDARRAALVRAAKRTASITRGWGETAREVAAALIAAEQAPDRTGQSPDRTAQAPERAGPAALASGTGSAWLTLREPEDARARSAGLAQELAAGLRRPPVAVHDLGAGTGSMMRWLAPALPGPQEWHLHDRDAALLRRARSGPPPSDRGGAPVALRTRVGDLADLVPDDLRGAAAITASALLDVLREDELRAVVSCCVATGAPALFALNVTGEVELSPPHPLDDAFRTAFNAHQQRESAEGRLLGPDAVERARELFARAGWRVRVAGSPWRLGAHTPSLLAEWLAGWTDAAVEQRPRLRAAAADYRTERGAQARAGALSVVVHHRDLLARPR